MGDIILNREQLEYMEWNNKCLGSGKEGVCYKVDNYTYKIYNERYLYWYGDIGMVWQLLKFSNIFIDNVYFIRGMIYLDEDVIGSYTDYAKGDSCGDVKLYKKDIDSLINSLKKLRNNLFKLSEYGIVVEDVFSNNILYDDDSFKLIDTSGYTKRYDRVSNEMLDIIYRTNLEKVMGILISLITDKDRNFELVTYLSNINSRYRDYLVDKDLLIKPEETILGIKSDIQEGLGREITTFDEFYNGLNKVRKLF